MDNNKEKETENTAPEKDSEGYVPRPVWQVWGARVGLVVFILFVMLQILSIARGGL